MRNVEKEVFAIFVKVFKGVQLCHRREVIRSSTLPPLLPGIDENIQAKNVLNINEEKVILFSLNEKFPYKFTMKNPHILH